MKISKTKLLQIVKEEVSSLVEAPTSNTLPKRAITPTKYINRKDLHQRQRRDRDRPQAAAWFGSDDPLITKQDDPAPSKSAEDPDKTVARSPEELAARDPELAALGGARQATHRGLEDPQRISITHFTTPVMKALIETYEEKSGTIVDDFLGSGEFGVVYRGYNDEFGDVAVKFTLSGQEINAYKNIKKLKDGLYYGVRDKEAGSVLPTIVNITTIASDPVAPEGTIRRGKLKLALDGQKYKVFVVEMELLNKLDPEIRSDVFGPNPADEYPPEVRKRFIDEYLSIENIYSSLEKLMGGMQWEKILARIEPNSISEGPTGRSIELPPSSRLTSLPIKDERAFAPFREIDRYIPRWRASYRAAPEGTHHRAVKSLHKNITNVVYRSFAKYVKDRSLLEMIKGVSGYVLPAQMAANTRLPQYDPEAIAKSPGLRSAMMPPSELQTSVAKSFYNRLKKLEEYDVQYGDVHANNLMMRDNGDLVVADVGLFMFGPQGSKNYAGTIAERFQRLAGIIIT
ncbi:MAG TPA: hypothetical protein EYN67_14185 [Flavobacteriales bacterium]|nr:hypothetical protein [Flavobacteriales bacterium]